MSDLYHLYYYNGPTTKKRNKIMDGEIVSDKNKQMIKR